MIEKLHYISQQPENGTHISAIQSALHAGCKWIQLRVKNEPQALILAYALRAKALCEEFGAKLIVNDHPEIAVRAGAYGLHLGLQDMPIAEARKIVGPEMIIGGTANTFEHIAQRVEEGADYIGLGPYRFTKTKEKLSPVLGLQGYQAIMKQVNSADIRIPIIAIGGIIPVDIPPLMETGIYGVAVSGTITYAADPTATIRKIHKLLKVTAFTHT